MATWIKPNIKIDFIGRRNKFWALSTVLVLVSIGILAGNYFVRGDALNYGTDFKGGTQIQIEFAKKMSPAEVRSALHRAGYKGAEVVQMEASAAGAGLFMLRMTEVSAFSDTERQQVDAALKKTFGDKLIKFEHKAGGDRVRLYFKRGFKVAGNVPEPESAAAVEAEDGEGKQEEGAADGEPKANADAEKKDPAADDAEKKKLAEAPAEKKESAADAKASVDGEKADGDKADDGEAAASKPVVAQSKDAKKASGDLLPERADFKLLRELMTKAGIAVQNVVAPGRAEDNRYEIVLGGLGQDVRKVFDGKFGAGTVTAIPQVESVGAKMGQQLRDDGVKSVLYALLLMLVYIAFRFDFRYAPGAVVALAHDVIITTGIFGALWMEFSLPVVAALLTIAGYSINDTIVVFDRIRENVARLRDRKFPLVVNASINETLSRTLLTSLTTLFTCVSIWIVGTGVLKTFAFALTAGVLIGTYSSIFIASPLVVVLNERFARIKSR